MSCFKVLWYFLSAREASRRTYILFDFFVFISSALVFLRLCLSSWLSRFVVVSLDMSRFPVLIFGLQNLKWHHLEHAAVLHCEWQCLQCHVLPCPSLAHLFQP